MVFGGDVYPCTILGDNPDFPGEVWVVMASGIVFGMQRSIVFDTPREAHRFAELCS